MDAAPSSAPARELSQTTAIAAPSLPGIPTQRSSTENATNRRSRRRSPMLPGPLGSLTQRDHRPVAACQECGSFHVTLLTMNLTDGTPVEFTSCHRCERRSWQHAGGELSVDVVLERARKE